MRRGLPHPSTPAWQRVLVGAYPLALCVRRCLAPRWPSWPVSPASPDWPVSLP